jgi:2-dehydro-3-deoxyphosphooctonate aldolase (KDO 8-P synthase)
MDSTIFWLFHFFYFDFYGYFLVILCFHLIIKTHPNMLPNIPNLQHTESGNFFLISGPCVVEGEQICMDIAGKIHELSNKYQIPYVFKASFKKANRTRVDSFTGIGNELSLEIIKKVSQTYGIPTTTDIHETTEAALAAQYVDVLQIPAFLCRQTDLLVAAAHTGKCVNIKKGQFLSAAAMKHAINKVRAVGNHNVIATERGTTFGYNDLVVDFRSIPEMQAFDVPVVMDITHSVQQPNQVNGVTGGAPAHIHTLAKAAMAVGVNGIFIETHPDPNNAKSDGANMLKLTKLEALLEKLLHIQQAVKN